MHLTIQRSPDPVPYAGAYVRLSGGPDEPARAGLVLAPPGEGVDDAEVLARLLGLVLTLGDARGGAPIRQYWLGADLRFEGKLGSEVAPRHAAEAERLGARVRDEWNRFLTNALARLRGEARGDAHFRYPGGRWDAEQPAVRVTTWPPLPGEALPDLE